MLEFDRISPPLPQALASALRRLAHLAHVSSWDKWASHQLTPTQRKILTFLDSRREAVSLSAVATDLGVTPATASDSVGSLEAKGLVRKRRSHVDGRAIALVLTAAGREAVSALAALPDPLRAAFTALSAVEQEAFYRSVIKMIRNLQETGTLPITRMCVRCKFFDPFRYPDSITPHHCHLVGAPFADRHLRVDCPDQVFNDAEAQQALWVRFNALPAPRQGSERAEPARGAGGRASGRRDR
jgi:DNA-binding MarR family transcriptional regulator